MLVINELMAANVGEVMSPATNFDSWIEIYNPGDKDFDLGGLYLSDDAGNLTRWQIPSEVGSVPAKGFKVVWLGSNDIKDTQATFKLDCDGGSIILSDGSSEICRADYPPAMSRTAWARTGDGIDEWGWTATATPGATNATSAFSDERLEAPVVDKGSCLFSGSVSVSVAIPEGATLMYTTDGSVPTAPTTQEDIPEWTDYIVNGDCEGGDASCLISRDADGNGDAERIVDGAGYDGSRGIRVHAVANPENDWSAQFFVYTPGHIWRSGEKYRFTMKVRADKKAHITTQTHTTPHNYIYWSILDGGYDVTTQWQEITYEGTITDDQVGKQGGGGWWWGGGEETVEDMQTIAFNLNGDRQENYFYFDDISWELYTGDGQIAETSKESKDGQFTFSKTTALTVRLFQEGYLPSVPVTRSYIKTSNQYTLPIVSIVGNKSYFTDPKTGLDCDGDGTNGKTGNGQDWPRNYNQPWDRPVNFSYLSPDGEMLFNQDVNISVSGGWTRSQRYRSFKLKSNKVFDGQNRFDFSFFPQKPYIRNKAVLVRNGGNDVWRHNARFMDPALETIIQRSGIDIDVQAYQPVIEYVNGELRGVLNLRETNNDKFAYANWGYDDDELDAFENFEMKNGTDEVLNRIFELGTQINEDGAYDELKTLLDIDEFTNYMAVTLYLFNDDWPDNNIKAYRSQHDGRYRFVSFDLDYAFAGCKGDSGDNPFTFFEKYKSMDFVQFFLHLLNHDEYRRKFIDAFCIVAGSVFEPTRAGKIIDELLAEVTPMTELMRQQGINDGHTPDRAASTIKSKLKGRSEKQTGYMKQFAQMELSGSTRQSVTLKADTEGATLFINGIAVPAGNAPMTNGQMSVFGGHLFAPVQLEAKAPYGYAFAGWKKGSTIISTDPVISLPEGSSVSLTATFTAALPDASPSGIPVRINEVSAANDIYVNEYFKRNDWVELYNTTSEDIDVAGMYLSDNVKKPQKYQIQSSIFNSQSTVIPAHGYLIVWCDKLESESQLHASFKLAAEGGDVVLTAADGSWSDLLSYEAMRSDETAGRYPDGSDDVFTMNIPTIAKANITSSYAVPVGLLAGDVNGDGAVDVADISTIVSVMAGEVTGTYAERADVNGDGAVNVADISAVITAMAGN